MTGPARACTGDRGSAIVDFTLVGGLVVVLFASVLQLAIVQHVRNTCVDAAAEGARYAAQVGRTPADGAQRTADLLRMSLAERYSQDVTARRVDAAGLAIVEVTVRVPLPVVGLLGPGGVMELDGHAPAEWP
ncbi:pilus assembly protein [Cellulomonas sp. zg-B12]|nr:pilus assembly protein [Cellulomonas xiejunii]MCC2315660.1 pilus assembly protein [Cellulomonas xiejunii]MCC2321723.1 pilus assembly protein [Cellulomonas xiejunii]